MSATELAPSPPRRPRWLQFSLRTLLLGMVVAALVFAWFRQRMEREERIERAVRLLALAPQPEDEHFDSLALVRAVNSLQALGQEDAIAALRRFVARHATGKLQGDPAVVLLFVVPLSFAPIEPEDCRPEWNFTAEAGCSVLHLNRRQTDIVMKNDLPLRAQYSGIRIIVAENWSEIIDWAEQRARLRGSPLRPPDDPVTVARELSSRYQSDGWWDSFQDQSMQAIANVVPVDESRDWSQLQAECRRLGIRWSEEKQQYVATKGAK